MVHTTIPLVYHVLHSVYLAAGDGALGSRLGIPLGGSLWAS